MLYNKHKMSRGRSYQKSWSTGSTPSFSNLGSNSGHINWRLRDFLQSCRQIL